MNVPKKNKPPRWAVSILAWLHPEETLEEVQGDLEELYDSWLSQHGRAFANTQYFISLLSVLPPFVRRRKRKELYHQPNPIHPVMISNYFKIALRSLRKNKLYTFINLAGLTLGLGVAITLFWIVRFEYSFDNFHPKADRIYRVTSLDKFGEPQSHVHQGVTKALNTQFPGVEAAVNIYGSNPTSIKVGTQIFNQKNIFFAHPEIIKILDIKWLSGRPEQSLLAPGNVIIDEETADKLFHGDALGKTFRYNNQVDLTVTGIFHKMPVNTEFPLQMVISWETLRQISPEYKNEAQWGGGDSMNQGLVLLKEGSSPEPVNKGLTAMAKLHQQESKVVTYELQPLSEMHFDTGKDPFNYSTPEWILYTLMSIAVFLVFIACVNFINLATVQAIQRSREIAMRKILGSAKSQLIAQFFGETAVLVYLAIILGALFASQLIRYSSELLNTQADQAQVWELGTFVFLLLLGMIVTCMAGFYPAIVLSGFQPVRALQNRLFTPVARGISLRSTLVVLQFVIAQVLVICTLLGINQIRYFYETNIGFEKSGIITVAMPDRGTNLRERFQQELKQYPEIREVTFGLTTPASERNHWWGNVKHANFADGEQTFRIQHVDTNYFDFFHIPLVAGRKLTSADTTVGLGTDFENVNVVVNEMAARDLSAGDPERALGQKMEIWGTKCMIAGVVKDYYSEDLRNKPMPHVFLYGAWNFQLASIRIDPGKKAEALEHIGQHWKELFPNNYYAPRFLEDDINNFYASERKLSNFLKLFAGVGIVIGSLGLFGLVSFVVTQRTKEIGVRKVLGATVSGIVRLVSGDFIKLVVVAFVIASPLAWYAMKTFLESYPNRVAIEWRVFALAGGLSLGVALLTISFQSVKAALRNPVKSLKSE
ncbi:hypothetical protein DYBT9275_05685 [Dyadobacter sp. CECT 9275]|uniref:FtsX-like permease family protein n=1 Tax=Dyadobacter helix TaxID=2822344 RepID=A0A916JIS4_9BACT|nr:ABC transporter permease [Dyadobacter sp. CECT 9275]CAG5017026.1 hypothetical protein DYBT9275_05685 [Dyadobacter sp. CECT 9275]